MFILFLFLICFLILSHFITFSPSFHSRWLWLWSCRVCVCVLLWFNTILSFVYFYLILTLYLYDELCPCCEAMSNCVKLPHNSIYEYFATNTKTNKSLSRAFTAMDFFLLYHLLSLFMHSNDDKMGWISTMHKFMHRFVLSHTKSQRYHNNWYVRYHDKCTNTPASYINCVMALTDGGKKLLKIDNRWY